MHQRRAVGADRPGLFSPRIRRLNLDDESAGYDDLDAHLKKLQDEGLFHRIDRAIDKDTEMHPLVRWQYRGGIPEADRKAFLFTKVTDAVGRTYPGAQVAIGALAGNLFLLGELI